MVDRGQGRRGERGIERARIEPRDHGTGLVRGELEVGDEVEWSGHTFELLDVFAEADARSDAVRADVRLDGGQAYAPAFTTYLQTGQTLPTPSVRTGLTHDVYLTIAGTNVPEVGAQQVDIEVFKKPLILWMWVGGLLMAVGTVLAAFPGKRRRNPLDPVSARIPLGDAGSTGTPSADEQPVETVGAPAEVGDMTEVTAGD